MTTVEEEPLNVVAIIQARMGSRRLPGKVLADLRGRPVLEWVVDAVKRVEGVHQIVVATTTNTEDKAIEAWCDSNKVQCFRGEPLDVLKRYADCAREYRATHVLRITADCPLLDSDTVSTVLRSGLEARADYFSLAGEFPDGFDCEGFGIDALIMANRDAHKASEREHVTPFLKNTENGFVLHHTLFPTEAEHPRLTVDQPEDLAFLRAILEHLFLVKGPVPFETILAALAEEPALGQINGHLVRNEGYQLSTDKDGVRNNLGYLSP